jgi:uncharacterized membrane-anchored protein
MSNFPKRFLLPTLVIVFQLLLLSVLAVSQQTVVYKGVEMHLPLEPMDPRDPFRGDYVRLNYEISQVEYERDTTYQEKPKLGQKVYVEMNNYSRSPKAWRVSEVDLEEPDSSNSSEWVHIQGEVTDVRQLQACDLENDENEDCYAEKYRLSVDYGIEEYFIEERSGWDLPSFENAHGVVFVDPESHKAVLKEVRVDGKKWP